MDELLSRFRGVWRADIAYTAAMPDLTQRLANRLGPRGLTTDADLMAPWLTDWRGRVTGAARAMVSPASREEVAFVVAQAAAAGVAIVPQGGNSSMVAGATPSADGTALLLSLRRMTRIAVEDGILTAGAGAVLADVHAAAAAAGRRFPLSLGAKGSATVGGLVSTNAGGTQVLRFGTMRALLAGIEVVLPDGAILDQLSPLAKDNRGYDLRQLFAGAEGTLGVVTAAALRVVPAVARAVGWAGIADPAAALALLRRLEGVLGEAVEGFELVPDAALALVLRHIPGTRPPLAGRHRWHVLIEAAAPLSAPEPALAAALADAIEAGLVTDAMVAANDTQAEQLWRIRDSISEAERLDGMAAKHDLAVAVAAMPDFMASARAAVEARFRGTRVLAFGHLGDGNVHFNVRAPEGIDDRAWFAAEGAAVTGFVHDLVTAAGGSISAEHGIGQLKIAEFARLGDPARLATLRAIKRAIDPAGIMNPGKLVPPPAAPQD